MKKLARTIRRQDKYLSKINYIFTTKIIKYFFQIFD
jgi:hypothetical protein